MKFRLLAKKKLEKFYMVLEGLGSFPFLLRAQIWNKRSKFSVEKELPLSRVLSHFLIFLHLKCPDYKQYD